MDTNNMIGAGYHPASSNNKQALVIEGGDDSVPRDLNETMSPGVVQNTAGPQLHQIMRAAHTMGASSLADTAGTIITSASTAPIFSPTGQAIAHTTRVSSFMGTPQMDDKSIIKAGLNKIINPDGWHGFPDTSDSEKAIAKMGLHFMELNLFYNEATEIGRLVLGTIEERPTGTLSKIMGGLTSAALKNCTFQRYTLAEAGLKEIADCTGCSDLDRKAAREGLDKASGVSLEREKEMAMIPFITMIAEGRIEKAVEELKEMQENVAAPGSKSTVVSEGKTLNIDGVTLEIQP